MVRLSISPVASYTSNNNGWSVAADTCGRVHVLWVEVDTLNTKEMWYARSTNGGVSFEVARRITVVPNGGGSPGISIAASPSGIVHIVSTTEVWNSGQRDLEVFYNRSLDGGTTWSSDTNLTNIPVRWSYYPSLAANGLGQVQLVWQQNRSVPPPQIYCKRSTDSGATWSAESTVVSINGRGPSVVSEAFSPWVFADWGQYGGPNNTNQIWLNRSSDGGATWRGEQNPGYLPDFSASWPTIAADGAGRVHILRTVDPGMIEYSTVYHRSSTDRGTTWETDEAISDGDCFKSGPSAACRDSLLHVVWMEWRGGSEEYLRYKRWSVGSGWDRDTILYTVDSILVSPSVAADRDGRVHVVWADNHEGNYEVYYMRWVEDPSGVEEEGKGEKRAFEPKLFPTIPNPAKGSARIVYTLGCEGRALLKVYNLAGQVVRTLSDAVMAPGLHTAIWDGRDHRGREVTSGVYFFRLETGEGARTQKLVVMR